MSVVGYARVSTKDQSLEVQLDQLTSDGVEKIFSDVESANAGFRSGLDKMMEYVREGDVVVVCRLDRLARSVIHLRELIAKMEEKGVGFRCIQQNLDTTTSEGRLMLTILGAFAEFELDIRRERQKEGIAKARDNGVYKGRKKVPEDGPGGPAMIRYLRDTENYGAAAIARHLKISKKTVYRRVPDGWGALPDALRREA